jgi:hypothetical protein
VTIAGKPSKDLPHSRLRLAMMHVHCTRPTDTGHDLRKCT